MILRPEDVWIFLSSIPMCLIGLNPWLFMTMWKVNMSCLLLIEMSHCSPTRMTNNISMYTESKKRKKSSLIGPPRVCIVKFLALFWRSWLQLADVTLSNMQWLHNNSNSKVFLKQNVIYKKMCTGKPSSMFTITIFLFI